jgi:hypothetical protein
MGLAVISPVGPKLLLFPLEHLTKQSGVLRHVVEWQSPAFTSVAERCFLLQIVAAVAALVRRPSWRGALPVLVFVPAALLTSRNVVVASLVLVPAMAPGLAGLGSLTGEERRPVFRPAAVALVAVGLVVIFASWRSEPFDLDGYPERAVDWLEDEGLAPGATTGAHVVTLDTVGNYLEARYGPDAGVFLDDRFDMFPDEVTLDLVDLRQGRPTWEEILERYEADAVLWPVDESLAQILLQSEDWQVPYRDDDWLVAVRE